MLGGFPGIKGQYGFNGPGIIGVQPQLLGVDERPEGVIFFRLAGSNNFAVKRPEGQSLFAAGGVGKKRPENSIAVGVLGNGAGIHRPQDELAPVPAEALLIGAIEGEHAAVAFPLGSAAAVKGEKLPVGGTFGQNFMAIGTERNNIEAGITGTGFVLTEGIEKFRFDGVALIKIIKQGGEGIEEGGAGPVPGKERAQDFKPALIGLGIVAIEEDGGQVQAPLSPGSGGATGEEHSRQQADDNGQKEPMGRRQITPFPLSLRQEQNLLQPLSKLSYRLLTSRYSNFLTLSP